MSQSASHVLFSCLGGLVAGIVIFRQVPSSIAVSVEENSVEYLVTQPEEVPLVQESVPVVIVPVESEPVAVKTPVQPLEERCDAV